MIIGLFSALLLVVSMVGVSAARFTATRVWLLRALATPELPQLPYGLDKAITHRWLALTAALAPILLIATCIAASFQRWWLGPVLAVASIYGLGLLGRSAVVPRELVWYIECFLTHAKRIKHDCERHGDRPRGIVAQALVQRLTYVRALYQTSGIRVPPVRLVEQAPLGDPAWLLSQGHPIVDPVPGRQVAGVPDIPDLDFVNLVALLTEMDREARNIVHSGTHET